VIASPVAHPRRTALVVVLAACIGVFVSLVGAAPALAKQQKNCAREIIEDWYDNQRVDKLYPVHCYHDAIDSLGPDAKNYTNLPEAILRALAYRQVNRRDPGTGADNGDVSGKSRDGVKPVSYRHTADIVSSIDSGDVAAPRGDSGSNPSSIPIPLIVLAGLAGVLLLAGGAGYVARRINSRRGGPPSDSS
jgi:hypothetical protein